MSQYIQADNSIDVISSETSSDYELFFGPIAKDQIPLITNSKNLGEILAELGLIQSKNQARKTPWWRPVVPGFSQFAYGKNKIQINIFTTYREVI